MPSEPKAQEQPMVGIFWLFSGQLILDKRFLSEGEDDGEVIDYPKGHSDYWEELQQAGIVPRDIDYEEPPRGRILFKKKSGRFALYADRCILRRRSLMKKVMKAMHLQASQTDVASDGHFGHYRCFMCLMSSTTNDEDF